MNINKSIAETLSTKPFSYGESIAFILENQGKPISSLPEEDFMFPDKSIIRVTNFGVKCLEFLAE